MLDEPIAVTGGAGFIGSNLVRRLVELGHERVLAVDCQIMPHESVDAHRGARFVLDDLSQRSAAIEVLGDARTVFHLAADMGGVGYFHSDADFAASTTNTLIDINVLRAVCATGARTFVASSACAYPIEQQMTEGEPPLLAEEEVGHGTPDALYGAAKLHLLRMAAKLPNVRTGILHTVYGPLCEREGRRMKFPAAVATKALRARETGVMELWGNGRQMRSYLYVDDAVDRILQLTDAPTYEGPVNIGYQGAVTCMDIAALCLTVADVHAVLHLNLAEPSGVLARDCDNTEWERRFGPTDDVPPEEGFRRLIEWLDS
jgi:nucleoside-diphosphate-sugar epimerase